MADIKSVCLAMVRTHIPVRWLERLHMTLEREVQAVSGHVQSLDIEQVNHEAWELDAIAEEETEHIERLLGIAIVASQSYLTSVRTAVARASALLTKWRGSPLQFVATDPKAYSIFGVDCPSEKRSGFPVIQVINAIANCWKHNEEWPTRNVAVGDVIESQWNPDADGLRSNERDTIKIVSALGLSRFDSGNLRQAVARLGVVQHDNLAPIRDVLEGWGERILERTKSALESAG
jgi:hypothetical protein